MTMNRGWVQKFFCEMNSRVYSDRSRVCFYREIRPGQTDSVLLVKFTFRKKKSFFCTETRVSR